MTHASLTSYKALDVVGFAQFKQKYEQRMEERTRSNPGRITKEEFLIEIEKPYIEGLSPENIMKAFEVTGTWPVDRSKVSRDMVKPSFSLSFKTPAAIEHTSPVKAVLATFRAQLEQPSQQPPVLEVDLNSPGPGSHQPPPTPSPSPGSHKTDASGDIQAQLLVTRAAFLADKSLPSSTHQVPQLVMPPLPPPPFSSDPPILPTSQPIALTVEDLEKRVAALEHDNCALKQWGTGLHADVMTVRAQLVIQNVENEHLHTGLYQKEQKRKTSILRRPYHHVRWDPGTIGLTD